MPNMSTRLYISQCFDTYKLSPYVGPGQWAELNSGADLW